MKCRISTHHELINTSQPFVPVHPPLLSRCRGRNEGKQNGGRNRNKLSQNMNLAYTILTIWNVQVYLTPGLFCGPRYMVWSLHMPAPPPGSPSCCCHMYWGLLGHIHIGMATVSPWLFYFKMHCKGCFMYLHPEAETLKLIPQRSFLPLLKYVP